MANPYVMQYTDRHGKTYDYIIADNYKAPDGSFVRRLFIRYDILDQVIADLLKVKAEMNPKEIRVDNSATPAEKKPGTTACQQCNRNADIGKPCWWCGKQN